MRAESSRSQTIGRLLMANRHCLSTFPAPDPPRSCAWPARCLLLSIQLHDRHMSDVQAATAISWASRPGGLSIQRRASRAAPEAAIMQGEETTRQCQYATKHLCCKSAETGLRAKSPSVDPASSSCFVSYPECRI